jgi:hypothetical protein
MRLKFINESKTHIDSAVHTKVPFYVQWSAKARCEKGERIKPFFMQPNVAYVCDIIFEKGRKDSETEDMYTVVCQFLYGGLNGGGCIGTASAGSLSDLISYR